MRLQLTNILTKACFLSLIINANLASGRKRHKKVTFESEEPTTPLTQSETEEVQDWAPDAESVQVIETETETELPKYIDFRGVVRSSLAMHMALADPNKNSVCSPISALLPLGKLVLGASGEAETELLNAIGHTREELKPALGKLIDCLIYLPGVTLKVASKIYASQHILLNPKFTKESKKIFHSTIENVDFANRMDTIKNINNWVKRLTNGMIPNLLSPTDISRESSVILVNAVYFQGNWKKPFQSAGVSEFFSPMGARRVPMITDTDRYNYINDDSLSAEILELPYANDNASFVIVLPNDRNGLPMLLTALKLAPKLLNKPMKKMTQRTVKVVIPKFKVSSKLDLKHLYKKIGVNKIFHQRHSELDNIVEGSSVHVSAAIQQAVIEVTESGTKAAAGSASMVMLSSMPVVEILFKANRPFIFFVLANSQQIFVGVYNS
ncbi:antichymotrypsin-2 [Amyelois transitella]|uniref:antichymotrypsin-2 n=1 Tax=Amyelois transitella TaxID=680683 RepID=UPI00298F4A68|nr:antichymotrypsin-2 [Amyelois transitella]